MLNKITFTRYTAMIAVGLAFIVITVGAYTRLADAGLGCPDWPGCYGQLTVPQNPQAVAEAQALYPDAPVEQSKAWIEMTHRYLAGSLGLLIFLLAGWLLSQAKQTAMPWKSALLTALLVIFQAALGMWTVTWQLLPVVVMGHLLGGITILALLWSILLRLPSSTQISMSKNFPPVSSLIKFLALLGGILVFIQIALGGWVSANYAALICPTFPDCNGALLPHLHLQQGFNFLAPVGANYLGGYMDQAARVTIHMVHRYGALFITLYLVSLVVYLWFSRYANGLRLILISLLLILALQITLGIVNVLWMLPLPNAVAHNGVAALLLLTLITLIHRLSKKYHYEPNY
jgi:cytochrome c oxidase assembly protein subunit 15